MLHYYKTVEQSANPSLYRDSWRLAIVSDCLTLSSFKANLFVISINAFHQTIQGIILFDKVEGPTAT